MKLTGRKAGFLWTERRRPGVNLGGDGEIQSRAYEPEDRRPTHNKATVPRGWKAPETKTEMENASSSGGVKRMEAPGPLHDASVRGCSGRVWSGHMECVCMCVSGLN
ncbi:hypothetical protein ZHAS_00016075 [Anopheles sinensis]|uniref:Uncharacterized protein n=1 Tax=Anopheles sinensis TaxID=74873 RepID=A0A084WD06_ANOSI|nr:hypothetical protein ZHAS_00016075 [Anopheles sinensis]